MDGFRQEIVGVIGVVWVGHDDHGLSARREYNKIVAGKFRDNRLNSLRFCHGMAYGLGWAGCGVGAALWAAAMLLA